jgi:hypothetical protein
VQFSLAGGNNYATLATAATIARTFDRLRSKFSEMSLSSKAVRSLRDPPQDHSPHRRCAGCMLACPML